MAYVYPRLPRSIALQTWEMRVEEFVASGESPATLTGDAGIDPLATFDPTGMRVTREILEKLRQDVLEVACDSGFPVPASNEAYRIFEMEVGRILLESAELMPGEGGQPDIWSHMALVLLPDVAFWRWPDPDGKRKARFIAGVRQLRNVFEVCWFRALVLDDPSGADDRLHLMEPLTQDAMVAIVERPSLARCRPLARSLARAFPDVAEDPGSLSAEEAFRVLCKRMTLVGAVVNFDVLDESEIHELVLQQLGIVRGSSQPASDARESSSTPASSGPSRPASRTLPEMRSEDSRSGEPGEEMEATVATAVAEQARSKYQKAGVVQAPSGYENHEFWGPFYDEGVPEFPEFENCTPTGALPDKDEKIAPYLCSGYQVDIRYARSGNCCRLLNLECIDNNDGFERQVGGHVIWNSGGTVTVEAAPRQEQKTWSMERRVTGTLGVYRRIKNFVLNEVIVTKETDHDSEKSETSSYQRQKRDRASKLLNQSVPYSLEEDFTHKRPVGFKINCLYFPELNTWSLVLEKLCMHLHSLDPAKYLETPDNKNLLSARGTKYYSRGPDGLRKPRELCGGVFVETNISANQIRDNIIRLLNVFGIPSSSFEVFLREDRDAPMI